MGGFNRRVLRDANHIEIVKKLKKNKYQVIDLAAVGQSCPDILVADKEGCTRYDVKGSYVYTVEMLLVEIKMPTGRFYLTQLEFLAKWPGHCGFAETFEDVVELFANPDRRLSTREREIILEITAQLRSESKDERMPRVQVAKFERLYAAAGGRI